MPSLYLDGFRVSARYEDRRIVVTRMETDDAKPTSMMVPFFSLERVICMGTPKLTTPLLQELMKCQIPVLFLSSGGKYLGRLEGTSRPNGGRRIQQYRATENTMLTLGIVRELIRAKIHNMRRVIQRLAANRQESRTPVYLKTDRFLKDCLRRVDLQKSVPSLRGLEGTASAGYFQRIGDYFPSEIPFLERSRRPPSNPANALLSWTYTIAASEVETAILEAGLEPAIGFLHEICLGRSSLALDLLEPLRAPLCDLLVLNLLNHKMLTPEHFEKSPDGSGIYLSHDAKRIFFAQYEEYLERSFCPYREKKHVTFRQVIRKMVYTVCSAIAGNPAKIAFFRMP